MKMLKAKKSCSVCSVQFLKIGNILKTMQQFYVIKNDFGLSVVVVSNIAVQIIPIAHDWLKTKRNLM